MVVGIIGVLAAIGIPLYKAQQTSAEDAVVRNNGLTLSKMVNQLVLVKATIDVSDFNNQIQVKGKKLPQACFTILSNNGTNTQIANGNTWSIYFKNSGSCTELSNTYNGCIDSTGKITRDATTAQALTCKVTAVTYPDLNT